MPGAHLAHPLLPCQCHGARHRETLAPVAAAAAALGSLELTNSAIVLQRTAVLEAPRFCSCSVACRRALHEAGKQLWAAPPQSVTSNGETECN